VESNAPFFLGGAGVGILVKEVTLCINCSGIAFRGGLPLAHFPFLSVFIAQQKQKKISLEI